MKSKGIRIYDSKDNVVSVNLLDILDEIHDGNSLNWAILCADLMFIPNNECNLITEEKINNSKNGFFISWLDLNHFSKKIYQEIDLTLIGSKDTNKLHRYTDDIDMYENCDLVIEMIDSSYWEVFSHDQKLINRLAKKFNDTKLLNPDFER
jgi:hypothetical protein